MPDSFFDTNVLLYFASSDQTKAQRAKVLVGAGGVISVQVLNEIANVINGSWATIGTEPTPCWTRCAAFWPSSR